MDPDREALRTAIEVYSCEPQRGVWLPAILAAARRDLARMEAEVSISWTKIQAEIDRYYMAHGREPPLLLMTRDDFLSLVPYARLTVEGQGVVNGIPVKWGGKKGEVVAMEAEAPKRATLEELARACLEYGVGTTQGGGYTKDRRLTEAAAVLRKLKEFRDGWRKAGNMLDESGLTAAFLKSLP